MQFEKVILIYINIQVFPQHFKMMKSALLN